MFEAGDVLAMLRLEDSRMWGEAARPEQWHDATAVLDATSTTPYHFLTRARGWSKTTDLAAIMIAVMLTQLPVGSRAYAVAADRGQGALLLAAISGFVARTPLLRDAFRVDTYKVTALASGVTVAVLAADASGTWGLLPHFIIVDELAQWPDTLRAREVWEALSTALTKTPGARLVALTSAGDPAHWSYPILQHAYADPLWHVHEIPGPPPWIDPDRLAEQRRRLPQPAYARLYDNEWTASTDRLTNLDDLHACVTLAGSLAPDSHTEYVVGVDLGVKRDTAVMAICHSEDIYNDSNDDEQYRCGARLILDRIEAWIPTSDQPVELAIVEEAIRAASYTFNDARVVIDPWQAMGMVQRFRREHMVVEEFSFSTGSVGHLALTLHQLLRNHAIALPNDPALLDELANLHLHETGPGTYRIDHDPRRHDDRAIALALAAHGLLNAPPRHRAHIIV
jgi:phage terminase large subunit-like protein